VPVLSARSVGAAPTDNQEPKGEGNRPSDSKPGRSDRGPVMARAATPRPRLRPCICWRNHALGGATAMSTDSPTVLPTHADNSRAGGLTWRGVPPGMPSEIADAMIAKLKDGSTVRKLTCGMKQFGAAMVPWGRFKKHCELHPEWAAMAWRISKANTAKGKGAALQLTTHCRAGLHLMTGSNEFIDGSHGRRRCLACRKLASKYTPPMAADVVDRVKRALENGASLTQITNGRPTGGGRRNPKLIITSFKIIRRHRQRTLISICLWLRRYQTA
jgi:hypothetical protein